MKPCLPACRQIRGATQQQRRSGWSSWVQVRFFSALVQLTLPAKNEAFMCSHLIYSQQEPLPKHLNAWVFMLPIPSNTTKLRDDLLFGHLRVGAGRVGVAPVPVSRTQAVIFLSKEATQSQTGTQNDHADESDPTTPRGSN